MAKKKASAKKAVSKKALTASKKTPTNRAASKKALKKTVTKKTTRAPAKKVARKAAKKIAKKAVKKVVKKAVKKSAPKITKKATPKKAAKKTSSKAPLKSAAKKSAQPKFNLPPVVKTERKKLNLSHFISPLDDRLIVQISGSDKMTEGGLYIPDTVADFSGNLEGIVVAVGMGHRGKKGHLQPMDVKLGDQVVFEQHAGVKIKIENEDLIILRESDVLGVVSK